MLHELAMCATNDTGANVEHAVQGEIDMAFGTMICELTSITGKEPSAKALRFLLENFRDAL